MAEDKVAFQGLPARICWLGYGERNRAGLAFNDLVANGDVSAPIVIGRDHLDSGSVASPYRETESMLDGSDAIADWPILNALLNTASGASWVSVHHGGGVGIGRSIHSGTVAVADGTELAGPSSSGSSRTTPPRASCDTPTPATSGRGPSPASGASGCRRKESAGGPVVSPALWAECARLGARRPTRLRHGVLDRAPATGEITSVRPRGPTHRPGGYEGGWLGVAGFCECSFARLPSGASGLSETRSATSGPGAISCTPSRPVGATFVRGRWRRRCTPRCCSRGYTSVGEFHYLHHSGGGKPYPDPNAMGTPC